MTNGREQASQPPEFSIAEVIAHLDEFERAMVGMTQRMREYRHALFEVNQHLQALDETYHDLVE